MRRNDEWRPEPRGINWTGLFWWTIVVVVVLTPTAAAVIHWFTNLD